MEATQPGMWDEKVWRLASSRRGCPVLLSRCTTSGSCPCLPGRPPGSPSPQSRREGDWLASSSHRCLPLSSPTRRLVVGPSFLSQPSPFVSAAVVTWVSVCSFPFGEATITTWCCPMLLLGDVFVSQNYLAVSKSQHWWTESVFTCTTAGDCHAVLFTSFDTTVVSLCWVLKLPDFCWAV